MTVLQLFSRLFGYDYERVRAQPTASRQKIVTLGTLVLIPVFIWVVSGYYLSGHLLGTGFITALMVGLILGGIILIIDRSFIAAPKGKYGSFLAVYRLLFALITTFLGALALDLMIFGEDLEEYRSSQVAEVYKEAKQAYILEHQKGLDELKGRIAEEESTHKYLKQAYIDELDGKSGTGFYGEGPVAKAKKREAEDSQSKLMGLRQELESAKSKLEEEASGYAQSKSEKKQGALLSKLEDLHSFLTDRPIGMGGYLLFMGVILFLECAFVFFKFTCSQTLYEDLLQAEEEIGKKRLKMMRERRDRITKEDGLMGRDAAEIRRISGDRPMRRIV